MHAIHDWRWSISAIAAIAISLWLAGTATATTLYIDNFLFNASFENPSVSGEPLVSCPAGWTCQGSPAPGVGTYTVTSAQYTPGSDGLPAGEVVPDGTQAAFSPTTIEGSGDLWQTTSLKYVAGDTYVFSFWVGQPNSEPGGPVDCGIPNVNCVVNGFPSTVEFNFTSGPTIAANGLADPYIITSPGQGQWELITESFTAVSNAGYIGTTVGVDFHVATSANNQAVNFDIDPPTPEPAAGELMGLGLLLTGLYRALWSHAKGKSISTISPRTGAFVAKSLPR